MAVVSGPLSRTLPLRRRQLAARCCLPLAPATEPGPSAPVAEVAPAVEPAPGESESVQAAESAPAELEMVQATEPLLTETFTEGDGDEAKNEDAV